MNRSGLMSLLTQKIYLSLIGVILVLIVFGAYLITAVLDTPLTSRPKEVKVELAYTGGLFDGSAVTYRGVKIGKVTDIALTDKGVVATAALITTEKIPKDSVVKVRSLSPVGEQYLDFQPKGTDGPYLEDGATIPASSTQLPETLGQTVVNIKALLDQINPDHVHRALTEIATGLNGTGEGIGRLVDQGDVLLADIEKNWPLTQRLLTNGRTVLRIAPSEAENIATIATSSKQFAAFLKQFDPTFRKLLAGAPKQMKQLDQLLNDVNKIFPKLLDRSIDLNDLLAAREPHLRALLQSYAPGVNALAGTFRDGRLQLNALVAGQKVCDYGTARRNPTDPNRHPLQADGVCSAGFNGLVRGAAHAPAPLW
jgi:virulence factor Mce-like protein